MLYLLVLIYLYFLSVKYDFCGNGLEGKRQAPYVVLCLLFILIAGLRYLNGGDTLNYYENFMETPILSKMTESFLEESRYQPGFVYFTSFIKTVFHNFVFYQLIFAIILNVLIFTFIKKQTTVPFFSIIMYFILNYFEFNMEIMRESISVGLGCMLYLSLEKKKLIFAILLFVIALMIHISAVILLVFPFIKNVKFSNRKHLLVLIFTACIPVIYMALPNVDVVLSMLFNQSDWMINKYATQEIDEGLNINFFIRHVFIWVLFPMYALRFLARRNLEKYTGFIYLYVILHLMSMISYAFYRLANYLSPFYWIFMAEFIVFFIQSQRDFFKRKAISLGVCVIIILYFYQQGQLMYDKFNNMYFYERYIPYKCVMLNGNY